MNVCVCECECECVCVQEFLVQLQEIDGESCVDLWFLTVPLTLERLVVRDVRMLAFRIA